MSKPKHRVQDKYADLREKLWTALMIALFLAAIGSNLYIQIIHHP